MTLGMLLTYLCYYLADLSEVCTPPDGTPSQEIFNQPRTDVVPHLVQLFIDFRVVFIVLDELHYESTIRQGEQLCILVLGKSGLQHTLISRAGTDGPRHTIFSALPFQMSSPIALYCLLVVAIED